MESKKSILYILMTLALLAVTNGKLSAQSAGGGNSLRSQNKQTSPKNSLIGEGIEAFERGDAVQARALFEKALKINSRSAEAHGFLGILDDQAGDLKSAEIHFAKAARLAPNVPRTRNNYGAILLRLDRKPEARAEFEASLKLNPQQTPALINLAQIRFAENTADGWRAAETLFARAARLAPDAAVLRSLIVTALRLGDAARAEKYYLDYQKLLIDLGAQAPTAAESVQLGEALFEAGLINAAETELHAAHAREPGNGDAVAGLGRVYLARNDIKSAGRLLETAVAENRATAEIYSVLTVVYEKSGRYDNAIAAMRLAIERAPESEAYRFQYGLLLANADAPAAAIVRLDEALKTFPRAPRLWLARGIAELKGGKNAEAAESFAKALELDQNFAPARVYLGLVRSQMGQYLEAVAQYERALPNSKNPAILHQLIADALLLQTNGDKARAETELEKSIRLDAKFYPAYLTRGKLFVRTERWTEAAAAFEEVVRLKPDLAEAYYQLGRVYLRLKRKTDSDAAQAKFKNLSEAEKSKSANEFRETVRRLADVRF